MLIFGLMLGGGVLMFCVCAGMLGMSGNRKPADPAPVAKNGPRNDPTPVNADPQPVAEHGTKQPAAPDAPRPDPQDSPAAKQWRAKWMADQEAKAVALSKKIGEIEDHLAEREATLKRRMEAGSLDSATKKEIEQLNKELDETLHELHAVDETIAAGPPPYVPPEEAGIATRKPSPQQPSQPPRAVVQPIPSTGAKQVQVRGYTRKDGTYVQPHTRSAPRK